jgi:hypothetical protein
MGFVEKGLDRELLGRGSERVIKPGEKIVILRHNLLPLLP